MKILLIQPAKPEKAIGGEDFHMFEPLALEYLAAGVAGEHDVRILDMRLDGNLDSLLHSYQPDMVGITSYTVHVNKDSLITSNYDYFDFFHTLLPTTLPIKDFYKELITLYKHSRPLKNQLRVMRKYPLRELPSILKMFNGFIKRLDTLEQDYM